MRRAIRNGDAKPLASERSHSHCPRWSCCSSEKADVGDGLDVPDEAVVRLPGAEAGPGDARAAAGQPDKRRQIDGEPSRLRPAGTHQRSRRPRAVR